MAMRWRCPPDSNTPLSPTNVSYLLGRPWMNSSAVAMRAASATRSGERSGSPYVMFDAPDGVLIQRAASINSKTALLYRHLVHGNFAVHHVATWAVLISIATSLPEVSFIRSRLV